jgi:hypothetical protein
MHSENVACCLGDGLVVGRPLSNLDCHVSKGFEVALEAFVMRNRFGQCVLIIPSLIAKRRELFVKPS